MMLPPGFIFQAKLWELLFRGKKVEWDSEGNLVRTKMTNRIFKVDYFARLKTHRCVSFCVGTPLFFDVVAVVVVLELS
jgi:hypothetical protein